MKKNYSIVCLVQTIIMVLAVLFPVIVSSQELTDAEKQEKCQNNTNRIAELETELKMITAELSETMEKKEILDGREKVAFVNSALNDYPEKWEAYNEAEIKKIAARYNFDFRDCRIGPPLKTIDQCLKELEHLITKKIEKAVSLEGLRPALINKKNEIEKDLAWHKNNLIFWGCKDFDYETLRGAWEKDKVLAVQHFGFPIQFFHVEKNSITGQWGRFSTTDKQGKITGGSYDETTNVLSFTYVQTLDKKTGTAKLLLTETETQYKLRGIWKHDDGSASGSLMIERLK